MRRGDQREREVTIEHLFRQLDFKGGEEVPYVLIGVVAVLQLVTSSPAAIHEAMIGVKNKLTTIILAPYTHLLLYLHSTLFLITALAVRIMVYLTSGKRYRATISIGVRTSIIPLTFAISGPRTSPFLIHRNVKTLWRLRTLFYTLEF